jgi:hypothetical protein
LSPSSSVVVILYIYEINGLTLLGPSIVGAFGGVLSVTLTKEVGHIVNFVLFAVFLIISIT